MSEGKQAGFTGSLKVTGEGRVRMEKSFLMVLELYRGSSVMADRDLLSTLESAVLCSPRITAMLLTVAPAVQWAAVSTCLLLIRVPPQKGVLPFLETSPTCQGYSLTSVTTPPTILLPALLTSPHTHRPVDPELVVVLDPEVVVFADPDVVTGAEVVVLSVPTVVVDADVLVDEEGGFEVGGSLEM